MTYEIDRYSADDLDELTEDTDEGGIRSRAGAKAKRGRPDEGKKRSRGKSKRASGGGSEDFRGVSWLALTRNLVWVVMLLAAAGAGYWWRADVIAWLGWSAVPIGVWSAVFAYVLIARTGWFAKKWLPVTTSSLVVAGAVGILGIFDAPYGSAMGSTMGGRVAEFVVRDPFAWDRYNVSTLLLAQAWVRVGALFVVGLLGQVPSGYGTGARFAGIGAMMALSTVIAAGATIAGIVGGLFRNSKQQTSDIDATEPDAGDSYEPNMAPTITMAASMDALRQKLPDGHPLSGVADPEMSDAAVAFKRNATGELDYSGVRRDGMSSGLGSSYQSSKESVVFGMGQTLVSKPESTIDEVAQSDPPPFRDVADVLEDEPAETFADTAYSPSVPDAEDVSDVQENYGGYSTSLDAVDDQPIEESEESDELDDAVLSEELAATLEEFSSEFAESDAVITTADEADSHAMAFDGAVDLGSEDTPQVAEMPVYADPALAASRLEEALIDFPWALPPADSLQEAPTGGVTAAEIEATSELLEESLAQHGVEVSVDQIRVGPTVTMYGLKPGWKGGGPQSKVAAQRVRVDTILNREKDIALALKCPNIRFESVVPGAAVVGIEVPNADPTPVNLRSVMDSDEWRKFEPKAALPVPLGMGSGGDPVMADFATMPHTLVAGATGSGKSVCINTIITGLLLCRNPMQVRMVMIDPKRVELTPYQGIPHLYSPVVVEPTRALAVLKALTREMMERFAKLESAGVKNITQFNERSAAKMPYLLIVVDELADLMLTSGNEVEQVLVRLAQLGRATGVHLVVATQRPSVDVVTGLIKANFPSRISFSVMSQVDSRTILDSNGADRLLGKGDMLYKPINLSSPVRVQGAFLAEEEIESVVDFWKDGGSPPLPQLEIDFDSETGDEVLSAVTASDGEADLLRQASQLAQGQKTLSTSFLQRKLKIGYPRAARLMDDLEDAGVVGAGEPGKPRKVLQNAL